VCWSTIVSTCLVGETCWSTPGTVTRFVPFGPTSIAFRQSAKSAGYTIIQNRTIHVYTIQLYINPIGSMYAIYGNIYHQYTPNVSIYTIHGSYGNVYSDIFAGAAFSCLCILRRSAFKLFLVLNRTQQHQSVADQRISWIHPKRWRRNTNYHHDST